MTDNHQINVALLNDSEKRIIHLMCEAKSDYDIACIMDIELDYVKYCKNLIFQKTGSESWAELVIYAIRKSIFKIKF
jgi:DNA-binding CsgD family transcriptional regulator